MKTPTKPEKPPVMKTCSQCGQYAPHNWINGAGRYRYRCQTCHNNYNRQYRQCEKYKIVHRENSKRRRKTRKRENKAFFVDLLGGKCQSCGLHEAHYLEVYDFHHRDPSQKDINISQSTLSIEQLTAEILKCDLLCATCHRRLHAQLREAARK